MHITTKAMKLFSLPLITLLLVNVLLHAQAPTDWVLGTQYNKGSLVSYEGIFYNAIQVVPGSVGGTPDTLTDYWVDIFSSRPDDDPGDPPNIDDPGSDFNSSNLTPPEDNSARIINISTRGYVGTGNDILIAGFKLEGDESATKKCMIGVTAASLQDDPSQEFYTLKDPLIILYKDGVEDYLAINFSWTTLTDEEKVIIGESAPSSDKDPVIIADLGPGTYTAIVMGNQGLTGIATVGVNDLKMDGGTGNIELVNISTRGFVKSEPVNWMFAGFIIEGPEGSSLDVMVGNTAASLGDNPDIDFYSLKNPLMILYKDGVAEEIDRNDNWGDRPQSEKDTMSSTNSTPQDINESAIIRSLSPGTYNTVMLGLGGVGNAAIGVNVIP